MRANLDDADVLEALDALWLMAAALVSIALALWALYLAIDDLKTHLRLVGWLMRTYLPSNDTTPSGSAVPTTDTTDPVAPPANAQAEVQAGAVPAEETR